MRNVYQLQYLLRLTTVVVIGGVISSCLAVQEKGGKATTSSVNPSSLGQSLETEEVPREMEILVKFKSSVSQEEIQAFIKKHPLMLKEIIPEIDMYVFEVSGDHSVSELIKILKEEKEVGAIESQGFMEIMENHKKETSR